VGECVYKRVYINVVLSCKYSGGDSVWCVVGGVPGDRYGYAGKWGGVERGGKGRGKGEVGPGTGGTRGMGE
jgi:hypothetical protein